MPWLEKWALGWVLVAGSSAWGQSVTTIQIGPSHRLHPLSRTLSGACLEDVNHEVYGGLYSQMIFGESFQEPAAKDGVSGMWRLFRTGAADGSAAVENRDPFVGSQCQRLTFSAGAAPGGTAVGIDNQGLNHQGLSVLAGKSYEGHLWARADAPVHAAVSLASADGARSYATAALTIADAHWHRYDFTLTPTQADEHARFEFRLTSPGSAAVGYVFLQPTAWGRFHDLPVRGDVARALIDQGVTVLRYGGSMVNAPQYRWKQMIGDRDRRPPYRGFWYPQSSNGWGIADFLNFTEAAHILPVVDFNIDETPADLVDFLEYANGSATSRWGARRAADGHPAPYDLRHLELGNEERVDDRYAAKFTAIATALWQRDPKLVLTVGDFEYKEPIVDPLHFSGATSGITTLAAHQQILQLAHRLGATVWFDIHIATDAPPASAPLRALPSYVDAIDSLAGDASHAVVVFELNANNHTQARALANAQALIRIETDGRIPVVASANCLQVDGQNDNGWNQGLLFLSPEQVWLQPPGYALQMFSQDYQPTRIDCHVEGVGSGMLEAAATSSADGKTFVLQVVNPGAMPVTARLRFPGGGGAPNVRVRSLAGELAALNPAELPDATRPLDSTSSTLGGTAHDEQTFPPHSLSMVRWQWGGGR